MIVAVAVGFVVKRLFVIVAVLGFVPGPVRYWFLFLCDVLRTRLHAKRHVFFLPFLFF